VVDVATEEQTTRPPDLLRSGKAAQSAARRPRPKSGAGTLLPARSM